VNHGFSGISVLDFGHVGPVRLTVVGGFQLDAWDHVDLAVEVSMVESVDVVQCGKFEVIESLPGAMRADQFGLK
jgi:hypothetical protein